ncbi:MAG: efflux RND transporter permease subunit [Verrucomicrobiales bacterium]
MIRWFAQNGIAANLLMLGILLGGIYTALYRVPVEVTPSLNWNTVMIEMPYRGATAKDVERAILIPIEEALEGVQGIKQLNADGMRGRAQFFLQAEKGTDLRALMDEVKARIDTITTFPNETERPRVFIPESGNYIPVLNVAVTGRLPAEDLRRVARRVQEDILEMPGVSRAAMEGARRLEIAIEAKPDKLLAYNLSFQDLADAVRRFSIDLPAGAIESGSGTFVVRTRGQAYTGGDFANIPIRAANGSEVLLGEIAEVHDGFEEGDKQVGFNGKPALFVQVMRRGNESALDIAEQVREYVLKASSRFPDGIELFVWNDESKMIRARLGTLLSSMLQGALLVMLVLGLFLRPRLAFWIVWGIPVSFAGSALLLPHLGVTANVMSLFGYILVLGIVVDDAIVTGESIYTKMQGGMNSFEAAVQGTEEVALPVTFGCLTTLVAFVPLLFFDGTWGDYAKQIPPVAVGVLIFSLLESKLCLPAHLKYLRVESPSGWFARFQQRVAQGLERFVAKVYQPCLNVAVRHRLAVIALFMAMAMAMAGYVAGGRMSFVNFPSVDSQRITAIIDLPNDTPLATTQRYLDRVADAVTTLKKEFVDPGTGKSLIVNVTRVTGGFSAGSGFEKSNGSVSLEIMDVDERTKPGPRNSTISARWTELVGPIPEAETFRIYSDQSLKNWQEYTDENFHLELRGPSSPAKARIAREIKDMLQVEPGIQAAWAAVNDGQDELELSLKPRAAELGLNQALLAREVRQAFFGEEAQRVQRGVDDLRVMVRLPKAERESLHTLDQLKIRTPRGAAVPLHTVADVAFVKAPSFVERNDRAEVIRIGAQPASDTVDVLGLAQRLKPRISEMCAAAGDLSFEFKGHVADAAESRRRTLIAGAALLLVLFAMLAIPLRSLTQPIYILLAVPFSILGALLGHLIMDVTPSFLSVFGMLALAGVSVNDSLVLVDDINRRRRETGVGLHRACLEAGARRFRPILLTSATTFAGLAPLMIAKSPQAQFLIPMAVSLGWGILFATAISLFLVPCAVLLGDDVFGLLGKRTAPPGRDRL